MKCRSCGREFDASNLRCPACGTPNPAVAGVFQTSIVRISTGGADRVYHSLEEVPARLRTRLHRSTSSGNSATILIADRRGRQQIARTLRASPGALAKANAGGPARVAPRLRKAVLLIILAVLAVLAFVAFQLVR